MDTEQAIGRLREVAARHRELHLLLLYGSRSRHDAHPQSDWDLGYLADGELDQLGLLAEATQTLGTDTVDLVDLDQASGLLRFKAAAEGTVVYEQAAGVYEKFAIAAALHWYDVAPVVAEAHDTVLARI